MVSFIFTICAIRVNVVLFSALFFLVIAFGSLAGTYFHLALGNVGIASKLQTVSGNPYLPTPCSVLTVKSSAVVLLR